MDNSAPASTVCFAPTLIVKRILPSALIAAPGSRRSKRERRA